MRMLLAALAVTTLGLVSHGGRAAGQGATVTISGAVQFWSRTCRNGGQCDTPVPLGGRQTAAGTIQSPAAPGEISETTFTFADADLVLDLKILWPAPANGDRPYLVAQAMVRRVGGAPVAECSQFHAQDEAQFFPVGACAGFVAAGDEAYRELGVTFYKE